MKNYFMVLTEDQKNIIQGTRVESCDLNIDGHAGVVVDEENLRPALQSIGMVVTTETETSLEGIVKVVLQPTDDETAPISPVEPQDKVKQEEDRQRKLAEEQKNLSRQQYMTECLRRFEKTIKGTRQKVENGYCEIEELQKQLTRKIRETRGAERKLRQLNACRGGELEQYGKEFDSLSAVPGVEDVQVSDGVIKVFTEYIYITPDGHADTYDIGKFRMEIYTSGANSGIRFFNLTRKGKMTSGGYGVHHPHVNGNGAPCLGNISELVSQLIGEYEYSAVAQLGLQYLKSVNLDDSAGRTIFDNWPKKEK